MKHIKVIKHFNNLNPGEIAGFDDDVAADIVKRGLGEEVDPPKPTNDVSAATGKAAK
ncbi:hypothetical protein [Malikia sp.]|uniref:hypothetical protein n=1 Tax=Malikia sp. TaxID=2070706 RepID=UPI002630113C|nr:hypothetical protein [Malikia sp.]MDD2728178.1 hypothetical protein [Malikia sp.]